MKRSLSAICQHYVIWH